MSKKQALTEEWLESVAAASGETVENIKGKMLDIEDREQKEETDRYQKLINEAFLKFLKEPIPEGLELHEFSDRAVIIRLFDFEPPTKSELFVTSSRKASTLPYMTFSLAKVLAAGPESIYAAGDIVKLRDLEVRTLKNPKHEAWNNNPYSKSNAKKVGEAPPEYMSAAINTFGPKMFLINPLSLEMSPSDWVTFKVTDVNIDNKVKNPEKLVKSKK